MTEITDSNTWTMLSNELDAWRRAGQCATFWWRDDDAIETSDKLDRLDQLSCKHDVPLSLAVIPAGLQNSLTEYLKSRPHINVLQHGYAHQSHAHEGSKKIEIGGDRSIDEIAAELMIGFDILKVAFADQFTPVLVPPWNRIEDRTYSRIIESGFIGLSSMWVRKNAFPVKNLLQVNCHLDPVNWRQGRGFINEQEAVGHIYQHLKKRRNNIVDHDEPTGILTHHLDQDDAVWFFCDELFSRLNQHPATRWLNAPSIWPTVASSL